MLLIAQLEAHSMIKYVRVRFEETPAASNLYSYKCLSDVQPNDTVLVEARSSFALAKVYSVTEMYDPKATKWVVQKIDFAQFEKAKADEQRAQELQKFLKQKLVAKMAKEQFTVLASEDPEVAKAIAELEGIAGPAAFTAVVNVKMREIENADDEEPISF
jgi:hypothetical protein